MEGNWIASIAEGGPWEEGEPKGVGLYVSGLKEGVKPEGVRARPPEKKGPTPEIDQKKEKVKPKFGSLPTSGGTYLEGFHVTGFVGPATIVRKHFGRKAMERPSGGMNNPLSAQRGRGVHNKKEKTTWRKNK